MNYLGSCGKCTICDAGHYKESLHMWLISKFSTDSSSLRFLSCDSVTDNTCNSIWIGICLISSHLLNTKPVRNHQYDPMMNTWTKWFYSYLNYQYKFSFNRLIYHVLSFKHLFSIFSCQFSKNKFPAACVISVIRTNYCKLCLQERKLIK